MIAVCSCVAGLLAGVLHASFLSRASAETRLAAFAPLRLLLVAVPLTVTALAGGLAWASLGWLVAFAVAVASLVGRPP